MKSDNHMFGPPGFAQPTPLHPGIPPHHVGPAKFRDWRISPDGKFDLVHFRNGMPAAIPHGYVFDGYGMKNNGPRRMDTHDIRGDISNSEGMDAPNIWFNNSDCGQNF